MFMSTITSHDPHPSSEEEEQAPLDVAISLLRRDFGRVLAPRIRTLSHDISCDAEHMNLRVHYPAFRDGECTLQDLVDTIAAYIAPFALPRSEVMEVQEEYGKVSVEEYNALYADLHIRAVELFKKAQLKTNRSGEAGELILCMLTEWILDAPQILAKMALKTNSEMPVHGSDGVHIKFCSETQRIILFWGESKIHKRISDAIGSAAESIATAISPSKVRHEINLVRRNLSFSGLSDEAARALKAHLNPFKESSNERSSVITCLIGFDFSGYSPKKPVPRQQMEAAFRADLTSRLPAWAASLSQHFREQNIHDQRVELFFLPIPSVDDFRTMFQHKIGWNAEDSTKPKE